MFARAKNTEIFSDGIARSTGLYLLSYVIQEDGEKGSSNYEICLDLK